MCRHEFSSLGKSLSQPKKSRLFTRRRLRVRGKVMLDLPVPPVIPTEPAPINLKKPLDFRLSVVRFVTRFWRYDPSRVAPSSYLLGIKKCGRAAAGLIRLAGKPSPLELG